MTLQMSAPAAGAATRPGASYPQLLDALHKRAGHGTPVASASGYLLGSPGLLPGGRELACNRLGLACCDASQDRPGAAGDGAARARFEQGLMELHLLVLRQTLGHAVRHLEGRTSRGNTLLANQKVQISLADIAVELNECAVLIAAPPRAAGQQGPDPQARWRVHLRLVAAGRSVLRLFGASGFLSDGPGATLHLAEIAGNVYLHQGAENCHDQP
jgi:hypothetical protein